jgi:putative membrane protein
MEARRVGRTTPQPPGREPDYRFTLANERTFLAYARTALGLNAAGLAIDQFIDGSPGVRRALSVGVIVLGGLVAGLGYQRWRQTELAMRLSAPLPPVRLPVVLASGMVVLSAIAVVLVVAGR